MKEVLNHSSLAVTEVYARLNLAPVRDALEFNATQMLMLEHGAQVTPQPNPKPRLADGSRAEMDCPGQDASMNKRWEGVPYLIGFWVFIIALNLAVGYCEGPSHGPEDERYEDLRP